MTLISNEIFETYTIRKRVYEQVRAINLLACQGYTVIDLEGNIIDKWNLNKKNKPNLEYNRTPKLKKE
jgi:hypothetical protein